MSTHILKCPSCNSFVLSPVCPCGGRAVQIRPPKYSPEDRYAMYRRKIKKEDLQKKEML